MSAPINKPPPQGILRIGAAFGYSLQGIRAALRYEESFRLELIAVLFLFPLGLWLGENGVERLLLVMPLLLMLVVELLNSALETVVDRISVEHHPLSGRAKDIGSAACFLAQTGVVLCWVFILFD
ncbi:MAG: diacylglycerol kinase [Gammaproteobacteria bacterium]|nr:diacylglycerol kinase [Gammaproteobacteria bacterium]